MANAVSTGLYRAVRPRQRATWVDDPLDAMRGIVFGTLLSAFFFWLPLTLALVGR